MYQKIALNKLLIDQKMELLYIFLKKSLKVFQETEFSYISENGNPIIFLIFQKVTFQAWKRTFFIPQEIEVPNEFLIFSRNKAFLIFQKTGTPKKSLYFRKRHFLIYWERYIQNPGVFRTLAYLELEAYSEPWYIHNPRQIQNTVKHLRWNVLQK